MSANVRGACFYPTRSTYRSLVFYQALVVAAQGRYEHQTVDAFKAMHPFLPFRSLTANIEHVVLQLPKLKECLRDACRAQPGSEHVLIVGQIVFGEQAVYAVVIATKLSMSECITNLSQNPLLNVVMQCIFIAALNGGLHRWIIPQSLHSGKALLREGVISTDVLGCRYDSLVFLLQSVKRLGRWLQ